MANVTWDFTDRVVVITGSAIGMGECAVELFSNAGASVFGLDVDVERGAAVAERTGTTFVECDITSSTVVRSTFAAIERQHGRLDVLVNNAGGFW
jgi:NAD(P)-dependent dehydrogenase (short-subunit alcohol dehydrogenase family)